MQRSPSPFESTFDIVANIYRLIDALRADSADLRDTIRLSRASIRESCDAMRHAAERAAASPVDPLERTDGGSVEG